MKLHQKEIETVINLTPAKRYPYMVKRIADQSCLWSLWNSGWAMLGDSNNGKYFPIWSNEEYAKLYACDDWGDFIPKEIEIHHFIDKWSGKMKQDNIKAAAFPVINNGQISVSIDDFIDNVYFELSQIE